MRQAGAPRPPYPGVIPPQRPGIMPQQTRPVASMLPGSPNIVRNMPPPIPPPLRNSDSRNNMTMGPGPPGPPVPRPLGMPQQIPQQMRPAMDSGSMSPSGQVPTQRPFFPQPQMQGNRPQNPYNRPPFPRPPGGVPLVGSAAGQPQPQFARPPFIQQQSPGGAMTQQIPPKQLMKPAPPQQRPPSSISYLNDDDEDVVLGQAITPVKSVILKHDPMGPSLLEEPPFKNITAIEASTTETPYKSPLSNISNNIERPKNVFSKR